MGKLASKCVGIECKDIISAWFSGSPETAVGAKSGVALHAQKIMAFLQGEQVKLNRDMYFSVIVCDIKAAFPSASRVGIRKAIAGAVPKMLPIFDFKYHGRQTVMMLDENGELIVTQMTSGIIQGDELSMLFVCKIPILRPLSHRAGEKVRTQSCLPIFASCMLC